MKTKIIDIDRNQSPIDQGLLTYLYGLMCAAQEEGYESVDLIVRRLPANKPVKLVTDYELYETLQEIAKEFRATRASRKD